jgi:hypothetical protein
MMRQITEPDWKLFRHLRTVALERFCAGVLAEVERTASRSEEGSHQRYLEVYDLIRRRDKDLASVFNDPRRSRALLQLLAIVSRGLLTEEEVAGFGDETREYLESLVPARRDGAAEG